MFYTYSQNNSGGSFRGPAIYVIVEADSATQADYRAQHEAGIYFNGVQSGHDCGCCGDRWYPQWEKGDEVPSIYGQPVSEKKDDPFRRDWAKIDKVSYARIFYANGDVKTVE